MSHSVDECNEERCRQDGTLVLQTERKHGVSSGNNDGDGRTMQISRIFIFENNADCAHQQCPSKRDESNKQSDNDK